MACAAASSGGWRRVASKDLNSRAILSVAHVDVADVDVLDDIGLLSILP